MVPVRELEECDVFKRLGVPVRELDNNEEVLKWNSRQKKTQYVANIGFLK